MLAYIIFLFATQSPNSIFFMLPQFILEDVQKIDAIVAKNYGIWLHFIMGSTYQMIVIEKL